MRLLRSGFKIRSRRGNEADARCVSAFSASLRLRLPAVILICLLFAGCSRSHGTVLGKAPEGKSQTILAVRDGTTPPEVVLSGVMIEKCPTAGCWFRLKDSTGVLKVDTKNAGFVVVDVPLESTVVVAGKVVADGNDVQLEATGVRY
jgi:uncharacterized protein YdeI (BOF family)